MAILTTDRLILRRWRDSDLEPFARINADPRVMDFMPAVLSRDESDRMAERIDAHFRKHGFGLYAAELRADRSFIGFVGLAIPSFQAAFTPCVEIGWRLSADHWGKGLATSGARAVARKAFYDLKMKELVSFTTPGNFRSRRVMEALGMTHDLSDDFDHPNLPDRHVLRRHVLYRLSGTTGASPNP